MAVSSQNSFCSTPFWDLNITWYTSNPDFTICFQQTILTYVPCLFIVLFIPYELGRTKATKWFVKWNFFNFSNILATLAISALYLVIFFNNLGFHLYGNTPLSDTIAPAVWSVSYLTAMFLRISSKKNGHASSGVLFTYWGITFVVELIKYRSAITTLLDMNQVSRIDIASFGCHLAIFPLVFLVFFFNLIADATCMLVKIESLTVDEVRQLYSVWASVNFMWVFPLLLKGYKKILTLEDIFCADRNDSAEALYDVFRHKWKQEKTKHERVSIAKILIKTFGKSYLFVYFLRLLADLVQFLAPVLLAAFIDFINNDGPLWKGFLIGMALMLPTYLRMIFISNFFLKARTTGLKIRTMLTAAIYQKGLRLSNAAKQEASVGEMVNLMAVDTQKFIEMLMFFPQFCNAPITFTLALVQLWALLGPSCLAGLAILLILFGVNVGSFIIARRLQRWTMKLSDKRLKLLNEILNGIKVLKLYAWENPFAKEIQSTRSDEIRILSQTAYLQSFTTATWTCASVLMCVASFSIYVYIDDAHVLDSTVAFVSLTLFNIIRIPLITLPRAISTFIEASISTSRLDKFLNQPELDMSAVKKGTSTGDDALTVTNGNFTWDDKDDNPQLKDINISIPKGKLVAIVGRVGSGKTSLISAMLGDMTKQSGEIEREGKIGYVPQQAWIQNATVKNNILFYKSLRASKYQQVIHSCALKSDFELFIAGDATEIGEKGVNLSGGQKQRISLARAVYNDADLYLLDDPLSAVDAHVGKHIFDNVIGPQGMLQEKTRILATNSLIFLSQCDQIIVLKDGSISECGTYKQLLANDGAFAELILQYLNEDKLNTSDIEVVDEILETPSVSEKLKSEVSRRRSFFLSSEVESTESSMEVTHVRRKKSNLKKTTEKGQLVNIEGMEVGRVKFDVYLGYMRKMGLLSPLLCLAMWLCYVVFIILVNSWLSAWSNDSMDPSLVEDSGLRDIRVFTYLALSLCQVSVMFIALFILSYSALAASKKLHNKMLDSIIQSPMSFFDTTPMGRIMNRFSKDCNVLDITLLSYFQTFFTFMSNLLASLSIIVIQSPLMCIVLLPLCLVFLYIQKIYLTSSRQLKRMEAVSRSPVYSLFSESCSGSSSIRAYNMVQIISNEFNSLNDANHKSYYCTFLVTSWLEVASGMMTVIIIFFTSVFLIFFKDTIGPSSAGLAISFALNMTGMFLFTIQGSSEIETNIVSAERIMEYSRLDSEAAWEIEETKPSVEWPEEGSVKFVDYQTRYREGLDLVLKGINFEIKPGEKIGICGRTGAGKSSLTLALFRLIEPSSGSIIIDDVNVSNIGLHDLRSHLTIIPQDPVLFSGSLRFNLDPFSGYSDDDVWRALQLAHLKDYVLGMKEGLEAYVSEGGCNMSVGQRQLLCLARALLRKTKVLLLDEATAAVDLETDDLIQATIRSQFSHCTVITIAHRLNTIMESSRILVLSDGIVTEYDTPQRLLEDETSAFYSMVKDSNL